MAQTNKYHQRSLHIWFLKQFYVVKGMNWIKMLFTDETIRTKFPIFVDPQMSEVFSVFKYRPSDLPPTDPFIGIYGNKYILFRSKLLQGIKSGNIDPQYNGSKNDFIPLLAAALSLLNLRGSFFNPNVEIYVAKITTKKKKKEIKDYLMQCNALESDIEQKFVK
ncbi:hypothetical protein RFI_05463, partial [Reticulomyxa filosa]